jgi:3-hydroxyisobutyrate dehydrogenase-like beta-hydroxyacid dehydrogenase
MKVGFIGLGTMGAHMASNLQTYLLKSNHGMVVYDVNRASADPHIARGATWADSPKALAEQCDVIFASLPGPPEVEAVATGPNGARSGKLALWIGGSEAVFNEHKALLDAIGDQARYVGAIGAGSVAKLVHNCAGYCINTALAEVFSMGIKGGVEPLALWEAVRSGARGRARTFDGLVDQFLTGKYDPPQFALKLAHKDMTLATQLGRDLGVPMRVANVAHAEMTEALNRGWEKRDSRSPMLLQLERVGITISVDPERIKAALERDPPAKGDPKRS